MAALDPSRTLLDPLAQDIRIEEAKLQQKEVRSRAARRVRGSNETGSPPDSPSSPGNDSEMAIPELPLLCAISVFIAHSRLNSGPPISGSRRLPFEQIEARIMENHGR